ncbi:hypothetical protein D3C87_1477440 [compost metagenome]
MEAHGDLRFQNPVGLEEFHYGQGTTPRQVAIGQAVAAVVGMAVELNVVNRRISLHVLQHHLQLGFCRRIQIYTAAREADFRLFNLIEILRQQLGHTALIIGERLVEPDRQQAHFRDPAIPRRLPHHRAATVNQTADQPSGLHLRTVEQYVAAADPHRAQIDVTTPRLPRRSRRQQRGRATARHRVIGIQTKRRLLARAAHELSRAEIGDRLGQAALELVTFDRPLNALQTCLESDGHRRKAGKHTEQG